MLILALSSMTSSEKLSRCTLVETDVKVVLVASYKAVRRNFLENRLPNLEVGKSMSTNPTCSVQI